MLQKNHRSRGPEWGSHSKESSGVGKQKKEATGSYRSRSLEGVPAEREQRVGERKRKQQESIEVEIWKGSQPKESCGGGGRRRKQQEAI